jgi:hypothetical protein
VQSYSFGNSGPHAKIQNPRKTLSGRKVRVREEKEERKIITILVASTLAQRRVVVVVECWW